MRTVPLHGKKAAGRVALVDDEDYGLVEQYRWNVEERTGPNGTRLGPYARAYQPGPVRRRAQADQDCSVCGQRPAMARGACRPCYRRYWKAGRLNELAPAKPRLGGGRTIRMHVLLTGYAETDHWNGNGLDNQRQNLRDVTRQQNAANQKGNRGSTSRYKGVHLHRPGIWRTQFAVSGRQRHLGLFATEEEAARAYDVAAVEANGPYARLNFPRKPAA